MWSATNAGGLQSNVAQPGVIVIPVKKTTTRKPREKKPAEVVPEPVFESPVDLLGALEASAAVEADPVLPGADNYAGNVLLTSVPVDPVVAARIMVVYSGPYSSASFGCLPGVAFAKGEPVEVTAEQLEIIMARGLPLGHVVE